MSYTKSYHHIVFGTKFRQRTISRDRKERLFAYIIKIIENKNCDNIAINGMEEHVHILVNLHPTVSLSEFVKTVKQSSSRWISKTFALPFFEGWASEYYACSVSPSHVEAVKNYIKDQESHHGNKNYVSEVSDFVTKMGFTLYQDINDKEVEV